MTPEVILGNILGGVLIVCLIWLVARLAGKSLPEYLDPFDFDDDDD